LYFHENEYRKIGSAKVFKVGNYCEIDGAGMNGALFLRINDGDGPLSDNRGSLTVRITIR
jgi:hypothetical protein